MTDPRLACRWQERLFIFLVLVLFTAGCDFQVPAESAPPDPPPSAVASGSVAAIPQDEATEAERLWYEEDKRKRNLETGKRPLPELYGPPHVFTDTARVLVVAGQSNCTAAGTLGADPPRDDLDASLPWTYRWPPRWTTQEELFGYWGADLLVAREYLAFTRRSLYTIKFCWGSTSAWKDWNPRLAYGNCRKCVYEKWRAVFEDRTAQLWERGLRVRIVGVLWTQGENDASAAHASSYGENQAAVLDSMRSHMGAFLGEDLSSLPAFTPLIFPHDQHAMAVSSEKLAACSSDARLYCVGVGGLSRDPGSAFHWDAASVIVLGRERVWPVLKQALGLAVPEL